MTHKHPPPHLLNCLALLAKLADHEPEKESSVLNDNSVAPLVLIESQPVAPFTTPRPSSVVAFDRRELQAIMGLYGRMVAAGEWRDYAMDFLKETAVFSIFRRSSEMPLYRVIKDPALRHRQGIYSIHAPGGLILKRGNDLSQCLRVIDKPVRSIGS